MIITRDKTAQSIGSKTTPGSSEQTQLKTHTQTQMASPKSPQSNLSDKDYEPTPNTAFINIRVITTDPQTDQPIEHDMPVYISVIPRPLSHPLLATTTAPTLPPIPAWRPSILRPSNAWTARNHPREVPSRKRNVFGSSWAASQISSGVTPQARTRLYNGDNWREQGQNRQIQGSDPCVKPGAENRYACLDGADGSDSNDHGDDDDDSHDDEHDSGKASVDSEQSSLVKGRDQDERDSQNTSVIDHDRDDRGLAGY